MGKSTDYEQLLAGARLQKLGSYRQALITMKLELLIHMRNQKTTRVVQRKYREETKDPNPLQVFYVSNSHYRAHLEGFGTYDMPCSLEATGIPSVRSCALNLPSRDRFESIWKLWKINVPSAIARIQCWCSRSSMERRLDLRAIVAQNLAVSSRCMSIFYANCTLEAPQISDPLHFGATHKAKCDCVISYTYEIMVSNSMHLVNGVSGERQFDWGQAALEATDRWSEVFGNEHSDLLYLMPFRCLGASTMQEYVAMERYPHEEEMGLTQVGTQNWRFL